MDDWIDLVNKCRDVDDDTISTLSDLTLDKNDSKGSNNYEKIVPKA